jgi:Rad3-related DNA helicase
MITTQDWISFFPMSTPRAKQEEAINFILNAFAEGKRFVLAELPTGVGKSAIGITVARYLNSTLPPDTTGLFSPGAWFVTTQKILQDQYLRDFEKLGMRSVKSSSNYGCSYHKTHTCEQSQQLLKTVDEESPFHKKCNFHCVYKQAKRDFSEAQLSVTNFPYMLTDANYSKRMPSRSLLVIDEAHNIEGEIGRFVEVSISERFAHAVTKLALPEFKSEKQAHEWIEQTYCPKVIEQVAHMEKMVAKLLKDKGNLKDFPVVSRQLELMKGHQTKLEQFLDNYSEENWAMEMQEGDESSGRKVQFKTIDVGLYTQDTLFKLGERVLMMSATVLNKDAFCCSIGLKPEEVAFITAPSPFPPENRPILYFPAGLMGRDHIDRTLPRLAKMVTEILANHKKEKGIIHCRTYTIANYLKRNIKDSRLLIHGSDDRDEVLARHMASSKPTVLLSPSMTEGVDLRDDASRFQIICKLEFPYLGDKIVRKRMNKWKWWYDFQTAKSFMQAIGRSVRSESDHAVTYILDGDWERFYGKSRDMFPPDFHQLVVKT